MFGMLKSCGCRLSVSERRQWQGYVCGVCLALRNGFGHPARLATNTDSALIALLHDSLAESRPQSIRHFCPLRLPRRGYVPDPDSPGLRYASVLAMLMAATKVQDRVEDGEIRSAPVQYVAGWAANRWLNAAEAEATGLAFDVSPILDQVRRQTSVESGPPADFSTYARPTECAVGAAFRQLAAMTHREEASDILFEMGCDYGRMMYLLDSVQDYERDVSAGRFNPLSSIWQSDDGPRQIRSHFRDALSGLKENLARLEISSSALAQKLLVGQLACNGNNLLTRSLGCGLIPAYQTGALVVSGRTAGHLIHDKLDEDWQDDDDASSDDESRSNMWSFCDVFAYGGSSCDGCDCNCCEGDGCCCGCDCNCCEGDGCCCDGCDGCDGCDCDCGS